MKKLGSSKTPKASNQKVVHVSNKNVELVEDHFGIYTNEANQRHYIKRFTWKNHNKLEAQIITYGARVTSLKIPNRKGIAEDILLGFDDLGGYLYYDQLFLGATVGRVTGKIGKATCVINEKQYWLSVNDKIHHSNGGFMGFDKVVWTPSVEGTKVLLSYISRDKDEGYPGDLFVCISFELTSKNEFFIDINAVTTKPTIINLSNLLYFNLGAHGSGPADTYRHIVTINSNCFLQIEEGGLPSGEILNVLYSKNDFQIPKLLKSEIENNEEAKTGYESYLCVNRGVNQELCFVARALHPPSGRVLEVYSNQCGVYFSTANHLSHGILNMPLNCDQQEDKEVLDDNLSVLLTTLHACVAETLTLDSTTNYAELKDLIKKLKSKNGSKVSVNGDNLSTGSTNSAVSLSTLQIRYLENMAKIASEQNEKKCYQEIEQIIGKLLERAVKATESNEAKELQANSKTNQVNAKKTEEQQCNYFRTRDLIRSYNKILPMYTKDTRVHGKNDAIYKKHGAICFQTQNYLNAINNKQFPNSVLRPGETYKHTTVYRFWLQSGDPNLWMKKNCPEARENAKNKQ